MQRTLLIVAVLMLAAPAVALLPSGFATDACDQTLAEDPLAPSRILNDPQFSVLFPQLQLVMTEDRSRLPTIPVLWAQGPLGVCSLDDLPAVLSAHHGKLTTEAEFEAAAWLLAQTIDEEVMGVMVPEHVVSSARTDDGMTVVWSGLSRDTGMRVEFTVTLDALGNGATTWEAKEIVPGLRTEIEGWFLEPGQTGPTDFSILATETKLYPTHDGKNIRVTYFTQNYPNLVEAEKDADRDGVGGVMAYDTIKREWGFPSADPDNFLDITMDGCACIYSGNNVNIHMPANLWQFIKNFGWEYPDEDGVVYDVVAHEFFHHFQYSIMQWNQANWVVEGSARGIETIYMPWTTYAPQTLVFEESINGFNYFIARPDQTPQSHSYSYGIVWMLIADMNSGTDFLLAMLEESSANSAFPGFIDRALARVPGAHDSYGDALADVGVRLLNQELTWDDWQGTPYDWSVWMNDVKQVRLSPPTGAGTATLNLPEFAMGFVNLTQDQDAAPLTAVGVIEPGSYRSFFVGGGASGEFEGVVVDDTLVDRHVYILHHPGSGVSPVPPLTSLQNRATVVGYTQ